MSSISDSIQKLRERMGAMGKRGESSEGAAPSGKFDAKKAVTWVKAHPAIVASLGLMLIAPTVAWWFSSDLHAAADEASKKRASEMAALDKLEKTSVEIVLPGRAAEAQSGVVTPKMVAAYEELAGKLRSDAVEVQKASLQHNQKGRSKLFADIRVTRENANLLGQEVFDSVHAHVLATLADVRGGTPPADDGLLDQVQRRQDQFIAAERKADRKSLNEEQLTRLKTALLEKRLQIYADRAANLSFYADPETLGLPDSPEKAGTPPKEPILFDWQWRAWVVDDLLHAFATANKGYRNVVDAPIKRVLSITVYDDPSVAAAVAKSDAPPPDAAAAAAPADPNAPAAAPAVAPIDPKMAVAYNFANTFTGRVSNQLYDVRITRVGLVIATSMLPEVLNAIAAQNFMTVTNVFIRPADAFAAADEGYIYGAAPVSEVWLTIETVWMREWMAKLMPAELQQAKGTDGRTTDQPATDAAPEAAAVPPTT